MKKWLVFGACAIIVPAVAFAQQTMCGSRDEIVGNLSAKYLEQKAGGGIINGLVIAELFTSEKTWTIIITNAGNKSCVIAAGQNWEDEPHRPSGRDL